MNPYQSITPSESPNSPFSDESNADEDDQATANTAIVIEHITHAESSSRTNGGDLDVPVVQSESHENKGDAASVAR